MNFVPSRTSGFACQMHFFVVDTIHAIDSRSVEQYGAVKMSLDVSYCRVFCWDNFMLCPNLQEISWFSSTPWKI